MENSLASHLLSVYKVFNRHSVQYVIVGGTAVALHGYFRQSLNLAGTPADKPDLDFWYNPTYSNYFKLLAALEELGQNVTRYKEEQAPNPKTSFFRYELEQFTLDLLPRLRAPLNFDSSFNKRDVVTFSETDIPFISYDDLIIDKQTNSRPKDKIDIEQLVSKRKADD